jgi:hypothetical protein
MIFGMVVLGQLGAVWLVSGFEIGWSHLLFGSGLDHPILFLVLRVKHLTLGLTCSQF